MITNKLAWIDVETSGLFPEKGARVLEIGVVITDDTKGVYNLLGKFHSLIKLTPDDLKKAEATALKINGYNDETGEWKDAPYATVGIWKEVVQLTRNCTMVAQNWPFDRGFVENELKIFGLKPAWTRRFIDIMSFSWMITRNRGIKSFSLENAYNAIGAPEIAPHRSLTDIERCISIVKHFDKYLNEGAITIQPDPTENAEAPPAEAEATL